MSFLPVVLEGWGYVTKNASSTQVYDATNVPVIDDKTAGVFYTANIITDMPDAEIKLYLDGTQITFDSAYTLNARDQTTSEFFPFTSMYGKTLPSGSTSYAVNLISNEGIPFTKSIRLVISSNKVPFHAFQIYYKYIRINNSKALQDSIAKLNGIQQNKLKGVI